MPRFEDETCDRRILRATHQLTVEERIFTSCPGTTNLKTFDWMVAQKAKSNSFSNQRETARTMSKRQRRRSNSIRRTLLCSLRIRGRMLVDNALLCNFYQNILTQSSRSTEITPLTRNLPIYDLSINHT